MSSQPSCGAPAQPILTSTDVSEAPAEEFIEIVSESPPEVPSPSPPIQSTLESLRLEWQLLSHAASSLVAEGRPMSPRTRVAIFEGELSRIQALDFYLSIQSDGGPNGVQIFNSSTPHDFVPDTNFMEEERPISPLSVNAWDSTEEIEIEYEDHLGQCLFLP
ncbi:hypothetical protein Emed_000654 [Eimeria media]